MHNRVGKRHTRPSVYLRSPSRALGGPAYLRLAHTATYPITAVLLHDHDLTRGTVHSLTVFNHTLGTRGNKMDGTTEFSIVQVCAMKN